MESDCHIFMKSAEIFLKNHGSSIEIYIQYCLLYEPRHEKTCLHAGFPTRSDTNRAVQPQKYPPMFRGLVMIRSSLPQKMAIEA